MEASDNLRSSIFIQNNPGKLLAKYEHNEEENEEDKGSDTPAAQQDGPAVPHTYWSKSCVRPSESTNGSGENRTVVQDLLRGKKPLGTSDGDPLNMSVSRYDVISSADLSP